MKKFLSGILSMVLLISCLTISAFAAEAPKMEHTKVVGGVTVSNFVSMEEVDSRDFNNMPIHIVVVKKSRHEKYLFLICFFKSRYEEHFCGSCFFKSGHGQ